MITLHPIPPGLWCVPAALYAITGNDWDSVIHPALNRHATFKSDTLTGLVSASSVAAALKALDEMGFTARAYRGREKRSRTVATWTKRSVEKYPGRVLFVSVPQHVLVIQDGRVYDTWSPHGPPGKEHPFAKSRVLGVYLVEEKQKQAA